MPEILERTVDNLQTRAKFVPKSFNREARTVDVVFVTENPCRTFDWQNWRTVDEILSCDPSHVRSERFSSGVPVLDNHDRSEGTKGVLGIVDSFRFEGGKGLATLKLSKRQELDGLLDDIEAGIIRTVSVGYQVHKYEITEEEGKRPLYRAVDWEPLEISFAPVPADAGAVVRSQQSIPNDQNPKNQDTMTELQKRALAVSLPITASETEVVAAERAAAEAKTAEAEKIRKETLEAERKRSADITEAVRAAGLEVAFGAKLIADGTDINKSRELIINKLAEKESTDIQGATRAATLGKEQSEKTRTAVEAAIQHRVSGGELSAEAREFRGLDMVELGRHFLEQAGENTRGLSRQDVAKMSLGLANSRGYHSTSDFPNVLAGVVNKTLRKAYDMQPRTFNPFVRKTTNPDFKTITRAQLSGLVGGFDQIAEGGEYKHASFTDGKETYSLVKYGKKFIITWEALINDDLSAFDRIPSAIAAKAVQKQSDIVYAILTGNPNMADAVALFHANHGNLAGAGTTIPNGIAAARAAMRKQTDPNGDFINVAPRFLVCGPDKETEAQQLLNATIIATKTTDTNVFRGSHELIVEPRITGNTWFTIADPAMVDTIELCFLEGEGELFTERRTAFDQDGLEIKARSVFAAKAIDYRGMYKNPGA